MVQGCALGVRDASVDGEDATWVEMDGMGGVATTSLVYWAL